MKFNSAAIVMERYSIQLTVVTFAVVIASLFIIISQIILLLNYFLQEK